MIWPIGHPLQNGKYVVESILGQGGFGITYKARHKQLDSNVVIKIPNEHLRHDPDYDKYVDRFIQEGRLLDRLSRRQHPHIVRVRDLFDEGEIPCLVMDFVPGENLFQLVKQQGALPEAKVLPCIRQIAGALNVMHQEGLVHRDAHPGNIIVQNDEQAILIDFGIAKELVPSTQSTAGIAGNHGFAPYEQMTGRSSREPNVDVYCLAATLYYAITGERPATAFDRKLHNIPLTPPKRLKPSISEFTNRAILKGMALEASDRPQSMQAWLKLLEPPSPVVVVSPQHTTEPIRPKQSQPAKTPRRQFKSQTTPLSRITRQQFLKWAGFGGGGLVASLVINQFIQNQPQSAGDESQAIGDESQVIGDESQAITIAEPQYTPPSSDAPTIAGLPRWTVDFETLKVDGEGNVAERLARQAFFVKEELDANTVLEMVEIPGGSFQMGSPESEEGRDSDEGPQHTVNIQSFLMDKYAITQAQWQAIASFPKVNLDLNPNPSRFKGANRPVESISWHEAVEFCDRLSQKTGRAYSLPSEAEWEYACRAGTTTPFHFGETITTDLANYRGTDWELGGTTYPGNYGSGSKGAFREETTVVGQFSANEFGVYDMHGNVWEWCLDHWHDNYTDAPIDGSAWLTDDQTAARLLRGGSWYVSPAHCRSADRLRDVLGYRDSDVGFRVVLRPA